MDFNEKLNHFKKDCDERIGTLRSDFVTFKKEVRLDIAPLRDYMVGQQAIKQLEQGKDVSISPAILNILKWLVLIVAALVTGKVVL